MRTASIILKKQPSFAVNTVFNCHHRLRHPKVEVNMVIKPAWMHGAL